jgi:phage tail-like protein
VRGTVEGIASPHPIGSLLPPIYQDDPMAQRFTAGLDDVLAPVVSVLDNLDAYLDPGVAPEDFLHWLAGWVGVVLDETWTLDRQRELVQRSAALYGARGTVRGLRGLLELFVDGEVEVTESGGSAWSPVPGGALPGVAAPELRVRIRAGDPAQVDARRLEAVVSSSKPAHVPHTLEVTRR